MTMGQSAWRVIEWDDPRGDIGWAVIDEAGKVISKHMTRLSAVAAVERYEESEPTSRGRSGA